jgi:hypothetical protein
MNLEYKDYNEINGKFLFLPVKIWMLLVKTVQIDLNIPERGNFLNLLCR